MKLISKILVCFALMLAYSTSNAQIKNAKTETVKVSGNCGMCKTTIEKAGNEKKISKVLWNVNTKIATITYDTKKTNKNDILKRIALKGYDSDKYLAPDDVYANLPGCCQYDRLIIDSSKNDQPKTKKNNNADNSHTKAIEVKDNDVITTVFEYYLSLKDALIRTDGAAASASATRLSSAISEVKMENLPMDVHIVWMKVLNDLQTDSKQIAATKDASLQRNYFINLSSNMYALIKVSKYEQPVYYQFCPMANDGKGANWLSKEDAIKNPYYGAKMLTCGKTLETIK